MNNMQEIPTTTKTPRQVLAEKAWLGVGRSYNLCDVVLASRLGELGLRVGEHEVLAHIALAPGITQQELARRCFVAKSGLSMLLTRMEQQGWLRRESDARDGRIKRLFLERAGDALATKSLQIQAEVVEIMTSMLSDEELALLNGIAERVCTQLEASFTGPWPVP